MAAYDFSALRKSVAGMAREFQLKLGGLPGPVALYYPLESLNRLLGARLDAAGMEAALRAFAAEEAATTGGLGLSREGDRFCLRLSGEGAARACEAYPDGGFLRDFLAVVSRPGVGSDDILAVFTRYSGRVERRAMPGGEFDELFCFTDGVPDDFRYCVKYEGLGATYHRFTPADFAALGLGT